MLLEDFLVLEGELTSEERMSTESGLGELSLESSWMRRKKVIEYTEA